MIHAQLADAQNTIHSTDPTSMSAVVSRVRFAIRNVGAGQLKYGIIAVTTPTTCSS
jgi:hypothetical protein